MSRASFRGPAQLRARAVGQILRALFGAVVLAVVVWSLDPTEILRELAGLDWRYLWLAAGAQVLAKVVWTIRWRELLRACGLDRGFWELLGLVFVGLFFNTFLPTSMGGDLVRGFYAASSRQATSVSYAALLVERAVGLVALAALAAAAAGVALVSGGGGLPRPLLGAVLGLGCAIALLGCVLVGWRRWQAWAGAVPWWQGRVARFATNVARSLELLRRPGAPRLVVFLSSLVLQVVAILFFLACGRAVGLTAPALSFFLVVPIASIAAMLPISLNGLGVKEGVLVGLLVAGGASPPTAGAFALLALVVSTIFSLMGGLFYPFIRTPGVEARNA